MGCSSCGSTRGLAQLYAADGRKFLGCLLAELGQGTVGKWTPQAHTALYERASSVINLRGDRSPETMRLVAFAAEPQVTAEIAANLPMALPDDSAFWTCLGMSKSAAVESLSSKSGLYWNAVIAAGQTIATAEGGGKKFRRKGSLLAAGTVFVLGSAGMLMAAGGRR